MDERIEQSTVEPQTVGEARDAIERSRARISSTLDQIEDRIVEKKHELREKVDIVRPVRERIRLRPLAAVAVAVGIGAILGSLGGGSADDEELGIRRSGRSRSLSDDERRELRAWRRERRQRLHARLRDDDDDNAGHRSARDSRMDALRGQLMGAVSTAVTAAITSRVKEWARGDGRADARTGTR
jgi:ElaB/YqjD/DUF883 family membrane-anchored ribosome-binding protein